MMSVGIFKKQIEDNKWKISFLFLTYSKIYFILFIWNAVK